MTAGGSYSFTFKFAASGAGYTISSSTALAYSVNKVTTSITGITASPVSPASSDTTSVDLSADLTPADAVGTVDLSDGSTDLGPADVDADGHIAASADVTAGSSHHFQFVFTPLDSAYVGSSSTVLDYTVAAVTTSITGITASPVSPASSGTTSVDLSADLTPADADGSVHLFDGVADLGSADVDAEGHITASAPVTAGGSYSFTFKFAVSGAGYTNSASTALAYSVNKVTTSITGITASPVSPASSDMTSVDLSADLTPADAVGTVDLSDGSTDLGPADVDADGHITASADVTAGSSHHFQFVFTPLDSAYVGSSSTVLDYTVAAVTTSISTITASPVSPAPAGTTSVDLSADLTAADSTVPAGSVELFDGATDRGAATFDAATGHISKTLTVTDGSSHLYRFQFTASGAGYTSSTSTALAYSVNKVTTSITGITASPVSPASSGTTSVGLSATLSPADAVGRVDLSDGSTYLGQATVIGGHITVSAMVTAGSTHHFRFVFTPQASAYIGSSSSVLDYTVDAAPAPTTTTTTTPPPSSSTTVAPAVAFKVAPKPSATFKKPAKKSTKTVSVTIKANTYKGAAGTVKPMFTYTVKDGTKVLLSKKTSAASIKVIVKKGKKATHKLTISVKATLKGFKDTVKTSKITVKFK